MRHVYCRCIGPRHWIRPDDYRLGPTAPVLPTPPECPPKEAQNAPHPTRIAGPRKTVPLNAGPAPSVTRGLQAATLGTPTVEAAT